jgi:uncharacterized membrane protein
MRTLTNSNSRFRAFALVSLCVAACSATARADQFTFTTLDNANDPTFNQLLSINNSGVIAGYFGIGSAAHPNKGYTLAPPYGQGNYTNENFPLSVQTQVTGINNSGQTVGFYADNNGDNVGFVEKNGSFTTVIDPAGATSPPIIDQLLGVNDKNQAAGFYTDAQGNNHGYIYNITNQTFDAINIAGATSVTATDINNQGYVSGFYTTALNTVDGFLDKNGVITTISINGSFNTQFLGLNNNGMMVGTYVDAAGVMHGVEYNSVTGSYTTIDDPNGIGFTTLNGINDKGQIVGFYTDAAGNTHGLLVNPVPEPSSIALALIGAASFGIRKASKLRTQKRDSSI